MSSFFILLAYGGLALGFFFLFDGVSYLLANTGDRGESRVRRRLLGDDGVSQGAKIDQVAREEMAKKEEDRSATTIGAYLQELARQADSKLTPTQIYVFAGLLGLTTYIVLRLTVAILPLPLSLLIGAIVGVASPILYLRGLRTKRLDRFQEQFPDALDLIVRSLRIGHPLGTALQTIANEISAPAGYEFGIAARQVAFGKSLPEAIDGVAKRINQSDVRFFAVAVRIHHESGGNLAEILSGLARIIRERFKLFRKVKALTAEGRFSAWFLSIFPVVMIFAMNAMQPGYYEKVASFPYFPHMVAMTFVMLVVNVIAMRMMTKLEV